MYSPDHTAQLGEDLSTLHEVPQEWNGAGVDALVRTLVAKSVAYIACCTAVYLGDVRHDPVNRFAKQDCSKPDK